MTFYFILQKKWLLFRKKLLIQLSLVLFLSQFYPLIASTKTLEIDRYLNSLESQIQGLTYKIEKDPHSYHALQKLGSLWFEKSGYSGDPMDTKKAIDFVTKAIDLLSKSKPSPLFVEHSEKTKKSKSLNLFIQQFIKNDLADLYLNRARYRMRIHQFHGVKLDLRKAKEVGATISQSKSQYLEIEMDLRWNLGEYEKPFKTAYEKAKKNPNIFNSIRLASYYHGLGNFQESINYFDSALKLNSTSLVLNPVEKAWIFTQIAINQAKLKQSEQSEKSFQAAIKEAPQFIMALEHYAEFLASIGKTQEAISLYETIVIRADDPEFMGQLAILYLSTGKKEEANKLILAAKEKFLQLLKETPEAMYWHASEFFTTINKDLEFARSLLEKNLKLRPNSDSYHALAKIQFEMKDKSNAKKSILKVLSLLPINEEICSTAREILTILPPAAIKKCSHF